MLKSNLNNKGLGNKELLEESIEFVPMIGYKAVNFDCTSFYGGVKYEVGKRYTTDEEIIPCHEGYHFCKTLEDVMKFYPPERGIRYLKVKGVIKVTHHTCQLDGKAQDCIHYENCADINLEKAEVEFNKYKRWLNTYDEVFCYSKPNKESFYDGFLEKKYLTNDLTVLEEVPFEEYKEQALNKFIRTEEEYREINTDQDILFAIRKRWNNYSEGYFSLAFANFILNKWFSKREFKAQILKTVDIYFNHFTKLLENFDAIKDEKISQDLKVLLFLNNCEILN